MQETQRARQPEPERTRDAFAPKPTQRKESIQRSSAPQRLSLYEQVVGNRVPPPLRLSASPHASAELSAPRPLEEVVSQGEVLAPVSGEQPSPVQRREALRGHLWDQGVPPHLRLSLHSELVQRKENMTGLPDTLKAGVENLSGLSLNDVQVHYNSVKPASVQALAYTQGTEIHVGTGQEEHLPHEAWHVVQQMQRMVKTTSLEKGVEMNNDLGLEMEADVMGRRAVQIGSMISSMSDRERTQRLPASMSPMQFMKSNRQVVLPNILKSPIHELAGINLSSSFIIYHHQINREEPSLVASMTGLPPKGGFQAEFDQPKKTPTNLTEPTLSALEGEVSSKLESLPEGDYDFLFITYKTEKEQIIEFRYIKHEGQGGQGHGSMININEEIEIGGNIQVLFAGQFTIAASNPNDKTTNTRIKKWDNLSGHFKPATMSAQSAPLPINRYQSGHIQEFQRAKQELSALIINKLLDQIPLTQQDVEDLVGGADKILNYQVVDVRKFAKDSDKAAVAIEMLSDPKQLIEWIAPQRDEIISDFVGRDRSQLDNKNIVESFDAFVKELFNEILDRLKK